MRTEIVYIFSFSKIVCFGTLFLKLPPKHYNHIKNRSAEIFSILVVTITASYLFTTLQVLRFSQKLLYFVLMLSTTRTSRTVVYVRK